MNLIESFSRSYAQARKKFLEAAATLSLPIQSSNHPLLGRDGETLAMDVALDGAADAKHLLIVSSGCHGVEGYCGSGVQVFALQDAEWREKAHAAGVAVLYIHALNPHGFSWQRRVTHENVDLNRNFQDFSRPLPVNAEYAQLHDVLLPAQWPPVADNAASIAAYIANNGINAFQNAVTRGQHSHSNGLFYGGVAPTWSNLTVRTVLRQYATRCSKLGWIDLHTGLGPRGVGERIFDGRDDKAAFARAQAWWGNANNPSGETPVTSIYDGSSTSAYITGQMWQSAHEECPQAEHTGIAMEYGTQPINIIIDALRADHWLHLHPEASANTRRLLRRCRRLESHDRYAGTAGYVSGGQWAYW
jgi:Protein of unknown function (DUF2817)